jgi:hypothetical protein
MVNCTTPLDHFGSGSTAALGCALSLCDTFKITSIPDSRLM